MTRETVAIDFGQKPPVFRCTICGAEKTVILPMKLSDVTDTLDTFIATHSKCEEKAR